MSSQLLGISSHLHNTENNINDFPIQFDMPSQLDINSRLYKTKMFGFDQIVALSENNINDSFQFLFENDDSLLRKFKVSALHMTMEAVMNPPTVEVIVESEYHKVFFSLNFKSGFFEYPDEDETKTKVMSGWKFAFACNLNLAELENSKVPRYIKDAINHPGSYSVQQLLLDFQTADINAFSSERSHLPGLSKDEDDAEVYLTMFLNKYVKDLKRHQHNILGYAITVPDPTVTNPRAPTFPPTSLEFQTYAYRADGNPNNKAQLGNGCNQLLFLEMTGHRSFPKLILDWSGNWVIPEMAGTMAISKQNFWNRYLLPKLEIINRKTIARIESVSVDQLNTTWGIKYDDPGLHPSWNDEGNSASFGYQSSKSDEQRVYPPNTYGIVFEAKGNSSVVNRVQCIAGSPTIHVNGRTFVHVELSRTAYGILQNFTTSSFAEVAIVWKFDMTLRSVHRGGLEVKIMGSDVQSFPKSGATLQNTKTSEHADRAKEELSKNMGQHINLDIWKDIENDLNGQKRFVFPGGGTFDMKNPIFNAEGDLLVELNYKQ